MGSIDQTRQTMYPEVAAGGFSRVDGTVDFYQRINALVQPDSVVLDVGAGRGQAHHDDPSSYRRSLRNFKGRTRRVIGIDVDPVVMTNPSLDEAHLIVNDKWPVETGSVDVAFSDYTFEHVPDPAAFASEALRVLKPGGWLCARTPNKHGYISIASRLIPESMHGRVLRRAQPDRKEEDVFPTTYLLNTPRDIKGRFSPASWNYYIYTQNAEPAYFGSSAALWRIAGAALKLTPQRFWPTLMIFMQKK
ncbi:MAG TPA: methyltransferase domain-containing protein [Devosia sp.]|jgi:SAM-dependent methyltransferase|nr:methyltransferase domain-containing protein [Devosia sp.]